MCDARAEKSQFEVVSKGVNGLPEVVNQQTKECEQGDFSVNATKESVNGVDFSVTKLMRRRPKV